MKLKLLACILILFIFMGCSSTKKNSSGQVQDSTQSELNISVSSVSVSQVLSRMGQKIVGRPTTKLDLPEEYKDVPEIGSSFSPDFEKVLEVGTNLLIGDEMFKDKLEGPAKQYGIDTFYVDTSTYEKFLSGIEALGKRINKEDEANALIKEFREPIQNLDTINKDLKVAIIFGTSESNMLATKDTYIGSLVDAFGVKNVADEILKNNSEIKVTNNYVNLNLEQLLVNQPDIILTFGHGNAEEANKMFEKLFTENPAWNNLNAIKEGKVYNLDYYTFGTSANIHIKEALNKLGEIFNAQ